LGWPADVAGRPGLQTGVSTVRSKAGEPMRQEHDVMGAEIREYGDKADLLLTPPDIPEVTLPEYVLGQALQRGSKRALVDAATGAALTYAELATAVGEVSAGLAARGVGPGDVLALCAPNSIDFVLAYLAATSAGAVVTTVNPLWTEAEIGRQLRQCGARWLVSTADLLAGKLRALVRDTGIAEAFAIGAQADREATPFDALRLGSAPATAAPPTAAGSVSDAAFLLSSSGTTGLPKIVVLTHRNLVASLCQTRLVHKVTADDVVIAVLPLFHIFGLQISMNLALLEGATVVILPRFDLAAFFRAVEVYRATRAELVPPMVLGLAASDLIDSHDVSSLRVLTSGAAPLGADLARACAQRIGCRVKQAYGLTEIAGGSHIAPDDGPDRPDSIGPALPGVECRVVDSKSGAEAGTGAPGELLIRTPGTMRGYLGDPEVTAATVDSAGWLHTGDIVTVDDNGWYFVADRVKELIKYKGLSIAPAELEGLLLTHPAVADAAVVRHPDQAAGEVPKAYLVLRDAVSEQELMDWVAERVAPYKRVRLVEFTDCIPKSPSGKILRRLLVARGAGADEAVAVPQP
jgi:acyl-CoA synthetase (AMP-forming)/AMP-acid ligase II